MLGLSFKDTLVLQSTVEGLSRCVDLTKKKILMFFFLDNLQTSNSDQGTRPKEAPPSGNDRIKLKGFVVI